MVLRALDPQHHKHAGSRPRNSTVLAYKQRGRPVVAAGPPPPPSKAAPLRSWKLYQNPFYQKVISVVAPRVAARAGQACGVVPEARSCEEAHVGLSDGLLRCSKSKSDPTVSSSFLSSSQVVTVPDQFSGKFKLLSSAALDSTSPHDSLELSNSPWLCDEIGSPFAISNLHLELQRAHACIEMSQKLAKRDVEDILSRCAHEREVMQSRLQEKIKAAELLINEKLEKEKEAKENLVMENRMLSVHLTEAIKASEEAEKELEDERKARKLMEGMCDELAKQIVQDKLEVEELKRDHAQAEEEFEEELRMVQMADAWREERIQMKLLEAGLEIEARCMELDETRNELSTLLNAWKSKAAAGLPCDIYVGHTQRLLSAVEETLERACASSSCLLEGDSLYDAVEPSQDAPYLDLKDEPKRAPDNVEPDWTTLECSSISASDDLEWAIGCNAGTDFLIKERRWRGIACGHKKQWLNGLVEMDQEREDVACQANMDDSYHMEGKITSDHGKAQ